MDVTHSHLVRVSADVLEGLDIVWLSGETNMMDMREVQARAYIREKRNTLYVKLATKYGTMLTVLLNPRSPLIWGIRRKQRRYALLGPLSRSCRSYIQDGQLFGLWLRTRSV